MSPTASQIRLTLRKRHYLAALGVEEWQTDSLHPNRRKRLAALARSKTNQALVRLGHTRRYPMLVAFCQETYITLTDYVLRLFDEYWEDIVGGANRELVDSQIRQIKAKDGALIALGKAAQPIVDELNIPASELRQRVLRPDTPGGAAGSYRGHAGSDRERAAHLSHFFVDPLPEHKVLLGGYAGPTHF